MIEKTILDHLSARLAPTPCCAEAPDNEPGAFVVVEKTGSSTAERVTSATLAVQSYAARDGPLLEAAALNEQVKAAMLEADTLPDVVQCEPVTDYNFPDVTRKRRRYQAVFEVTHY